MGATLPVRGVLSLCLTLSPFCESEVVPMSLDCEGIKSQSVGQGRQHNCFAHDFPA